MIKYNLQYFADGPGGEKTEKPTARKREKAREEGQVVKSIEINTAFLLITLFMTIKLIIPSFNNNMTNLFNDIYSKFDLSEDTVSIEMMAGLLSEVILTMIKILAPIFIVVMVLGLFLNFLQVGFKITLKPLKPKLNRISPIQGFKRLFSLRAIFELIKSLFKIGIILVIVYFSIKDKEDILFAFYDMNLIQIIGWIGDLAIGIGLKIGVFFIFIAIADYLFQKYKQQKELKMTKQEVKDEHKMIDGNPEIKSKIRQKMREVSLRRMMQDLPKADVIITNPTHFAVAVQYDTSISSAPLIIAKGTDFLAARIKEKATEYEIEIVENKPLARTLYYTVDIGEEIPSELYQTVAEVLAFVYKLKQSKQGEVT
ncbi:MAG: flagellar biosynthesis protein FlhB [Eubacteriales bacterium]